MNKIKVSVIIAIYNTEKFLAEAIDSVLSQTLKELEIILVNDGSTDNSKDICQRYINTNPQILYIEQENKGVSVARNNGLAIASGDYVHFMDSDDTIAENFIESTYQLLKQQNADIAIIGEYFCNRFQNVRAFPAWALLISNDFLQQFTDIRFPENIQPCEDGLFSHMLFAQAPKTVLNPKGIYNYRMHENQHHIKIKQNASNIINQIPKWFAILENYYSKYDLFKSHSIHLALFMQHEPFNFRYLQLPLNEEQKSFLFKLIRNFIDKNVIENLSEDDKHKLNPLFRKFITIEDYRSFDLYYSFYQQITKLKQFLIKLIPIKTTRRKLRKQLKDKQTL